MPVHIHQGLTIFFVYLALGSSLWAIVFSSGLIEEVRLRRSKNGRPVSILSIVLSSIAAILAWPVVVWAFFAGHRRIHRARRGQEARR